jgi:hypothetical protein
VLALFSYFPIWRRSARSSSTIDESDCVVAGLETEGSGRLEVRRQVWTWRIRQALTAAASCAGGGGVASLNMVVFFTTCVVRLSAAITV